MRNQTHVFPAAIIGLSIFIMAGGMSVVNASNVEISKELFGKTDDGKEVHLFTLQSKTVTAKITNYGGIITELIVPDRNGKPEDIVLGFKTLDEYLKGHPFYGALVGRYCNRIAKGKFTIDGTEYTLATNNGPNHLHGGNVGFDKVVWNAAMVESDDAVSLVLKYTGADGEEGYPGSVDVTATYLLNHQGELQLKFTAETDKPTHVNLTNHSYFNLAGHGSGDILDQVLTIHADHFTPADATLIPTGEIRSVKNTPLDFTTPHKIGERIDSDYEQIQLGNGYDHNFVLNGYDGSLRLAAKAVDPKSGRVMEVLTTQPGVQLYTTNGGGERIGKDGKVYKKHAAFCLETQHFPDSPNHPNFPSTLLKPGKTYQETIVYRFSVE